MEYKGKSLSENLVYTIYTNSMKSVGSYNGSTHRFLVPTMDLTAEREQKIRDVFATTDLPQDEFYDVLVYVMQNVEATPQSVCPPSLVLSGEPNVGLLDKITLIESSGAKTELLYVGNSHFYVLNTSRSAILPGDVLEPRKTPILSGEPTSFNVYRGDSNQERFKPSGCEEYDPAVKFSPLTVIIKESSSEILKVVDNLEMFGGIKKNIKKEMLLQRDVFALRQHILESVISSDTISDDGEFPGYDTLLKEAMSKGITTYALHTLIENIESQAHSEQIYKYEAEEWDMNLTPEQEEKIRLEEEKKKKATARKLEKDLQETLKKISKKKVFFYEVAGKLTHEDESFLDKIAKDLDALAEEGVGSHAKGYALQAKANAIMQTKPQRGHNFKVFLIQVAIILVLLFIYNTRQRFNASKEVFAQKMESVDAAIAINQFENAKSILDEAVNEFDPHFLVGRMDSEIEEKNQEIRYAIDDFVEKTKEFVKKSMIANHGRIPDYAINELKEALNLAPEDTDLNYFWKKVIEQ